MPAPGGKGTELAARLRHSGASGPVNATSRIKGECRIAAPRGWSTAFGDVARLMSERQVLWIVCASP